ncbi:MAG: DUF4760 domain-containing protein [Paraglaciecola sp.]|uniref:DUF4760 domain-containing protein n=1 Tax=Paraglaciecola sp. TaxID=1920173 RepID=UPI0032977BE2
MPENPNYFEFIAYTYPTFFAIILSSFLTLFAAFTAIRQSRKTAREKNSIDFETSYKTNSSIVNAWQLIMPLMKRKDSNYLKLSNGKIKQEEIDAINLILNTWERAANGIFHNIYDGNFLYKTYGSTVLYLYSNLYGYIEDRQNVNPRFYIQFSKLYIRWKIKRQEEDRTNVDKELSQILKKLNKYT